MTQRVPGTGGERLQAESVLAAIESIIAPYIGAHLAKTSTKLHCKKLGIDVASALSPEQLSALVERLAKAMRVLIGKERTDEVVREIEVAVGESGA